MLPRQFNPSGSLYMLGVESTMSSVAVRDRLRMSSFYQGFSIMGIAGYLKSAPSTDLVSRVVVRA